MTITFDPAKRQWTLEYRGIDFLDAPKVFAGPTVSRTDERFDYGEERVITLGWLDGRIVVIVWTPRDGARRIISMRYAREKERKAFARGLAGS